MPVRKPLQRTFRIHRREDGRFESRNEHPKDSPLGVDSSLSLALGTAHREAIATSRDEGCRVRIEIETPQGAWKHERTIDPPSR